MVADKVRHVRDTGAEVVCAGDNSCLVHIGGALSRLRSGVRTLHLAEILASTGESPPAGAGQPAAGEPRRVTP
jgi:L-lactate dehydrogenase complex protein LldE